jgi:hypothetical protein
MTQSEKEPLVCIVDRKTWMRGHRGPYGQQLMLVNQNGTKCCLGFLGEACSIPAEQLHEPMPFYLSIENYDKYPKLIDTKDWYAFAGVNDDPSIIDPVREHKLQELAEKAGFTFKFVG